MRIKVALFLAALALMLRPAAAQTELMVNGGFEAGSLLPWQVVVVNSPTALLSATNVHSGTHCVVLANGNYYSQDLYQTITFPTNLIAATFSFYFDIATADLNVIPDATLAVYITDVNNNQLAYFGQDSNLNPTLGYIQFATNLVTYTGAPNLSYAGKTVRVHFIANTDGYGSSTQFYLDDVSMQVATTANIPVNDNFTNLTVLGSSPIHLFANNTFATKEPGEPNHAGNAGGHSLWWGWVAPSNGIVTLNTAGSSFQTLLAVYTGEVLTNLTPVAAVNNGTSTAISFKVSAGTPYDIAVDGYNGAQGSIVMNLGFAPDVTPPKVTITAPAAGSKFTNSFFLLQGKASDNVAVAQVQYRLENAAGTNGYQAAIGTTNWSVVVTNLIPGANTVRVRAFDTSSNVSPAVASTYSYFVSQPLTLSVHGSGTVSGATNGQLLHVGFAYKITALPKTGFGFAGWTGGVISNTPALTFTMQTNLALQANFMDTTRPTLTITNPAKTGARWSNEVFTVSGKCADNVAVTNVWLSWNSSAWMSISPINHGSNWSQVITALIPGTNTFAAYAVDASGNVSLTNTTKLIYVLSDTLTVSTNGRGTLTPNYNGKLLQIAAAYSMTAKASTGFGFVNWTDGLGDVITNGATLKFIMESNLVFVANFADITRPTLSITSPTANQKWSNAVFTVTGKCADNVAVSNVFVSVNTDDWTMATNNGGNWLEQVSLIPGTNFVSAFAVDTTGNVSLTNTVKFIYFPDTRTIIGTWNLVQFMTPAQITYDISNGLQGANFSVTNGNLTFDTNGNVSGVLGDVFTGTYTGDSNGVINASIVTTSGPMPLTFYLNAAKDTMTEVESLSDTNDNEQEIVVGHRIPAAVTAAQIAGTWNVLQYQTPAQITNDVSTGLQGGQNFGATNGTLTLNANFTFTGKVVNNISGTFSIGTNADVTLHSSTSEDITLYLNYNKNTMTHVSSLIGPNDNQQEIDICYRVPTGVTLASLAGTWNLVQFSTPAQIYFDGSNVFQGGDNFSVATGTMIINANGTISGSLGNVFTGSVTVGANGAVRANIISSGSNQTFTFFLNAAKDTMSEVDTLIDANDNRQELVTAHRVPAP